MATPAKKHVQWDALSSGLSDYGSPSSNISNDSFVSTSSLQYINSQLVSHGFVTAPGLSLDGISNSNLERTVKCLLELLGQRMKDMSRTEELATELRTLSYDHERLRSMHATAVGKAANAEREASLHKSRLQATTRNLQSTELAQKQTTAELQRTRGILQGVRATHQSELKKKEKDIEKMAEKWQKLADAQTKVSGLGSGPKPTNSRALSGGGGLKGDSYLEVAVQEAEKARAQVVAESTALKHVMLHAVNELQQVLHTLKGDDTEPTPFTLDTLFPFTAPESAADNLASVLLSLRDSVQEVTEASLPTTPTLPEEDRNNMQGVIDTLQAKLEVAKAENSKAATATQTSDADARALFDKFASDPRLFAGYERTEISVDLMTVPQHDELEDRLSFMRAQLEAERKKLTDASVKLGHERANIEAEKKRLQDEKRSWQVEVMLSELPPTPAPGDSLSPPAPPAKIAAPLPRRKVAPRSPLKKSPVKAIRKATRVKRRSSISTSPMKKSRIEPAYETEVMAHRPTTEKIPRAHPLSTTLLPTSFVLPPPSPQAALPPSTLPSLLSSQKPETTTPPSPSPPQAPQTPPSFRRPFPMAKPFAPRMVHAYSPARPSPLSRILLLGNSPSSLQFNDDSSSGMEALHEEEEETEAEHPFASPPLTLAQELGVPDSPPERPESPLHDQRANIVIPRPQPLKSKAKSAVRKPRAVTSEARRPIPPDKGRAQVDDEVKEKENAAASKRGAAASGSRTTASTMGKPPQSTVKPVMALATSRARVPVGGKLAGPRRVPISEVSKTRGS